MAKKILPRLLLSLIVAQFLAFLITELVFLFSTNTSLIGALFSPENIANPLTVFLIVFISPWAILTSMLFSIVQISTYYMSYLILIPAIVLTWLSLVGVCYLVLPKILKKLAVT